MARLWLPVVLLLGCAHAPTVSSERVVQLPTQSREQIVRARQGVDVADQNVTAARIALDQSQKFRDIANRELDAAKARVEASRAGIALGRSARSQRTIRDSRADYDIAMRELFAARAKKDYADRIVDLRRAEVDLRRAERNYANSDFEYVKYAQLEQEGMAGDLKQSDFENARIRAQNDVARDRKRVADLAGSVEQLRTAWMQRDQDYETASRSTAIVPPPPPRALEYQLPSEQMANPPPTFNPPPAGGVNEGPSAPEGVPQD
jgi:hypothetical protein